MTSRRSMLLGLVLGAFLSALSLNVAYAQVPRSISYQGLLVKNNQPVNGTVNVHIKIYNSANTMLYEESSQATVTNGIFNVVLGGNSGILPASLKFDEQYYLGVDVDNSGEVSPRTPFVAAPYALNSQTVGGIGVSVTPQAGMLLPLDANGKVPKTALPQSAQTLNTIDGMDGSTGTPVGNVKIVTGNAATLTVTDDVASGTITLTALAGPSGITTVQAGPGLIGGGSTPIVELHIAPNGITPGMLGNSSVRGINLDQNVPQWGLYQDNLGQLNIGLDNTLLFTAPTRNSAPVRGFPASLDAIGLNLNNPNTWTALQTFNAGVTVNGTTTLNGPVNITGNETLNGNLVVNGVPEPNVLSAGAVANYEIINNGDLRVIGATNLIGNTYLNQTLTVAGNSTLSGATNLIGTAGSSANTMTGVSNNIQAPTNNIGTTNAGSANTIGTATSTNTINGATTINGNTTHNGNITQTSGSTILLTTQTGNLTVLGSLTQSGGNATITGGSTNTFGTLAGSSNTFGGAGTTNLFNGQTNFNGNINQLAGNTTLLNTQVNGTLGSTGNITLGTSSTNNTIGSATSINSLVGATNNINATTNNVGSNNGSTNNIGTGSGDFINIGTSPSGAATTIIGNLNPGTATSVNGPFNVTGGTGANNVMTVTYSGDQNYLRIAGGTPSCGGPFPTSAQSELLVNGDGWFDGTLAACQLNIFGGGPSCIANLNTTNFGSCSGGVVPINLISGLLGVGSVDITNINNIQASNDIQANVTLTIGVPGTNATDITSSSAGPGNIAQQTPSVSGRIPTFQNYILQLAPGAGPNGGGGVLIDAASTAGALNFDIDDAIMVTYRGHAGVAGQLWVTNMIPGVSFWVESSAAGDNNFVTISILRN